MRDYKVDAFQATTQLMFSTIRISTSYPDGATGSGTGFFYSDNHSENKGIDYLITNKHVVDGASEINLRFHGEPEGQKNNLTINKSVEVLITSKEDVWFRHPDPEIDICAARVLDILSIEKINIDNIFYFAISDSSVPELEEMERYPAVLGVSMIGYPNGLWDEVHNMPLIRLGSTATNPVIDFNGSQETVIDIACFPGSSGSPIMFHDRSYFASASRFLGVLYAGPVMTSEGDVKVEAISTQKRMYTEIDVMINLGYVIKSEVVFKFISEIRT